MPMMSDGMGIMMVWGVLSFLLGLVLLFVFIFAVAAAIKWVWGEKKPSEAIDSANDILKKRYARGEISQEEFERIKKDIE